jgi:hypothetical protein
MTIVALLVALGAAIVTLALGLAYEAAYAQAGAMQPVRGVAASRLQARLTPAEQTRAGL